MFVLVGLAGLAMGGTGSVAFVNPQHVSPLYRPVPESQRVDAVVRGHLAERRRAVVELTPEPPPPRPRPTASPAPAPALRAGVPAARPTRVRGPPSSSLA